LEDYATNQSLEQNELELEGKQLTVRLAWLQCEGIDEEMEEDNIAL
jgi:hypothetical protein